MKKPSFQFYPGDWRKDQNLSRASKAAKGVFVDIMCLAFECEKRGVFKTGKHVWSIDEIAYAVGGDMKENVSCIEELLTLKVLKKDRKNAIFQSRIVRDEKLRKVRQEAGSKGGSPILVNQTFKQNPTPSTSSSTSTSIIIQTKETVWMKELQSDRHFFEQTCMSWQINPNVFAKMLLDFSAVNGKEHKDYHDFKTHFFNWGGKKYLKYKEQVEKMANPKMANL